MNISDVFFEEERSATFIGRRSKTNQFGDGQVKVFQFRPDARRCAPCAIRNLMALRAAFAEGKAELFRRLTVTGNVSKVAKELGFLRVTCYKWADEVTR